MRADELRTAVVRITEMLDRSELRSLVDRYRSAKGTDRAAAVARIEQAGATLVERMARLEPGERELLRTLHLDGLAAPDYWRTLLESGADPARQAGEIVRLASRVMFATHHLPSLLALLEPGDAVDGATRRQPAVKGTAHLVVRLADAGEKASDPDRVARSIDGIDMLYSACASIARKPAMDLQLDSIDGSATRDLHFTGERDAIGAVITVLESVPDVVAELDPEAELDLDDIVASLPIFADLATLASLGAFSESDLKDIGETMHQGALLTLEGGVVVVTPPVPDVVQSSAAARGGAAGEMPPGVKPGSTRAIAPVAPPSAGTHDTASDGGAATSRPPDEVVSTSEGAGKGDRYYDDYVRQREAMLRDDEAEAEPAARQADSVEELLKSLGRARDA